MVFKGVRALKHCYEFSNLINCELNKKNNVLVMFIDNSKAFDTISHRKLVAVLESIGIRGNVLKIFENYFKRRSISVKISDSYSDVKGIFSGVAQGSILGPTLYIIFVSVMRVLFKHVKHFVYADDTALVVSGPDVSEANRQLQLDYNRLLRWSHDCGLLINAKKTKLMHIRTPHARDQLCPGVVSHAHECIHSNVEFLE
jgi:hypothetical protein